MNKQQEEKLSILFQDIYNSLDTKYPFVTKKQIEFLKILPNSESNNGINNDDIRLKTNYTISTIKQKLTNLNKKYFINKTKDNTIKRSMVGDVVLLIWDKRFGTNYFC